MVMTKKKQKKEKRNPMMSIMERSGLDKKWQAEDDVRTLSQAKIIAADRARCSRACVAAKRMAGEKMKEARAMENIGKKV